MIHRRKLPPRAVSVTQKFSEEDEEAVGFAMGFDRPATKGDLRIFMQDAVREAVTKAREDLEKL